ncbi:hypothetical protein V8E36_008943 [Tilletia maclaganii]
MATPLKGDAHPINGAGWSDVYPSPSSSSFDSLDPATLAQWIQSPNSKQPGKDFLLLDVRRSDCEYVIPSAINLPAHSFYQSLPALLPLFTQVPILIFHCGNRNTRGIRCAGWLHDALTEEQKTNIKIYTLAGGYNGWEREYGVAEIESRGKRPQQGDLKAVPL